MNPPPDSLNERTEWWLIHYLMDARCGEPGPYYAHCLRGLRRRPLWRRGDLIAGALIAAGLVLPRLTAGDVFLWILGCTTILYIWIGFRSFDITTRLVESRTLEDVASSPLSLYEVVADSCLFIARGGMFPLLVSCVGALLLVLKFGGPFGTVWPMAFAFVIDIPLGFILLGIVSAMAGWMALGFSPRAAFAQAAPIWSRYLAVFIPVLPIVFISLFVARTGWVGFVISVGIVVAGVAFIHHRRGVHRFNGRTEEFLAQQFDREPRSFPM